MHAGSMQNHAKSMKEARSREVPCLCCYIGTFQHDFSFQLACLSLLLDAKVPSKSNSLFKRNNIMKIQRFANQFKYSDGFAKAVGLPPASTAARPRKRDLPSL